MNSTRRGGLVSLGGPILWGIMPTRSWITKPRCLGRGKIPKTRPTYLPTTPGWSSCHPCSRVLFIIPMMPLKRSPPWAREVGRPPEARSTTKQITPMPFGPGQPISRVSGWLPSCLVAPSSSSAWMKRVVMNPSNASCLITGPWSLLT